MDKLTEAQYPEYEPDAPFRCSRGCGEFRRDRCVSFRGQLCCPVCRFRWTLTFTGRHALSAQGEQQ